MNASETWPWLWDVPVDAATFVEMLNGRRTVGALDWKWALARLIDYAPYSDITALLPRQLFLERWDEVASLVRSPSRREGMAYVRARLLQKR